MREFFKGWRRKAGCVALMMALVLSVGWVRSLERIDVIGLRGGFMAISACGKFSFSPTLSVGCITADNQHTMYFKASTLRERTYMFSRAIEGDSTIIIRGDYAIIRYWSITIPLTLLSACLILWKPRQRTRADHA